MKKTNKKFISLFLLLIIISTQLSTVFAADYATEEVVVYENLAEYMEKERWYGTSSGFKENEEITQMWMFGNSKNITIKNLNDIQNLPNLEELFIYGIQLQEDVVFSNNKKLKTIYITEYKNSGTDEDKVDLSNVTFDFRSMDCLNNLYLEYEEGAITREELPNRVKFDNNNMLNYSEIDELDGVGKVLIRSKIYDNVKEAIETVNGGASYVDSILTVSPSTYIKDYSDLYELTDLKEISMDYTYIEDIDFNKVPALEKVYISNSVINGKLDFSRNSNLKELSIRFLSGDKSNTKIDITGLNKLTSFNICSLENDISDINRLKNIVLMDDYNLLYKNKMEIELPNGTYSEIADFHFEIYEDFNAFAEKYKDSYELANLPEEEITEINFWCPGVIIKDLSSLLNLKSLYVANTNVGYMDFSKLANLETLTISESCLNKTLNFNENRKLTELSIELYGDLSNAVVDISEKDWLEYFNFSHYNSTNFSLTNSIKIKDYDDLSNWVNNDSEKGEVDTYYFSREIYNTIDEFLEANYSGVGKDEIIELDIMNNVVIKDYSELSSLINLTELNFYNCTLESMDFEIAPKLNTINISNCKLHGTLDFSGNTNLRYAHIDLYGDLSNAVVDIRGLSNLEGFYYGYYTDKSSNFNLDTCILRDNTIELDHNSDTESMYEGYYYNKLNNEPEYPNYIISNLHTYQIEEGISGINGFVLNDKKVLTLGDILSRNYFAEGITAKVFKDGEELTNNQDIIGTGMIIKLYEGEDIVGEYNIIIYGDTTGDGLINTVDALAIIKNKNEKILFPNRILAEAGKVTEKSYWEAQIPTAVDALAIIKYSNGKYNIDQRDYYYSDSDLPITG